MIFTAENVEDISTKIEMLCKTARAIINPSAGKALFAALLTESGFITTAVEIVEIKSAMLVSHFPRLNVKFTFMHEGAKSTGMVYIHIDDNGAITAEY